jgi:hypothetical protein
MDKQEHNYCLLVVTITGIVILAACGIGSPNTPMTPLPTVDVTFTPSKQITKTLEPAGTMEPTFAYLATAQEARFDAQHTQVAETKQAIFTISTQYTQMCGYQLYGVFISPDGEWIASDCRFDLESFRVFQTQGNQVWEIPYSEIFPYYPDFLGSVRALHWSPDWDYLYFVNNSCCADVDSMSNGDALYRLNLQTGHWKLIIAGNFNYYSFSPDGQQIVYILNNQAGVNNSLDLHLLELNTGKEALIDAGSFEQAGWAVWKQDGQQIALIAQTGSAYADDRKIALIVADLQNQRSETIIPLTEDSLAVVEWSDDDILKIEKGKLLEHRGYYLSDVDLLYYDLKTDQFIAATPVP